MTAKIPSYQRFYNILKIKLGCKKRVADIRKSDEYEKEQKA